MSLFRDMVIPCLGTTYVPCLGNNPSMIIFVKMVGCLGLGHLRLVNKLLFYQFINRPTNVFFVKLRPVHKLR